MLGAVREVGVLQRSAGFVSLLEMQKTLEMSESPCSGMPFLWEPLMIHMKSVITVRASSGSEAIPFP